MAEEPPTKIENKVEENKKEEEKPKDPLDGKSIDELKEMVITLQKKHADDLTKIRGFTLTLQANSMKLKEIGIDLGILARNTDRMLQGIMENRLPDNLVQELMTT